MSRLTSEHWPSISDAKRELQSARHYIADRTGLSKSQTMWLAGGLVALGVAIVAWSYLGPDLRRYIKIHNM